MQDYKYIYGPVPSRRLGISLGISPIPKKVCNYSCIYCQLGRTQNMTNSRQNFFDYKDILKEFKNYIEKKPECNVITIVGEGEPLLYSGLGNLINSIKKLTDIPIAVITNGALLFDENVCKDLENADIIMPSIDFFDENSFKKINRPYKTLTFDKVTNGLIDFSKNFKGKIWLEIMLVKGYNDDIISLKKLKVITDKINYDKIYINTVVRPPAENSVKATENLQIQQAVNLFNAISIENLISFGFYSNENDNFKAVLAIIKRHPMNQFEIESFLKSRDCKNVNEIISKMNNDNTVQKLNYKGYITYRLY